MPSTRMAVSVVEELFIRVQGASAQDLECLDQRNLPWLPQLGPLPPPKAVQEIGRALEASSSVAVLLSRLSWLHCWLVFRRHIRQWRLFRFGASAQHVDYDAVIGDLSDALQTLTFNTSICVWHDSATYCISLINNYANPTYQQYRAMFLVLWRGQRYAAAHATTYKELQTLTAALHIALRGESVELLLEQHADLDTAFSAAQQNIGGSFMYRYDNRTSPLAQRFRHRHLQRSSCQLQVCHVQPR